VRYDGFAGKQGQPIGSWSTPLILRGQRDEIVLSIVGEVRGFDPKTSKELWRADGISPLVYTSALVGEGVVFGSGGFGGSTLAVKAGGSGDLSNQKLWYVQKEKKNRISSGIITKGHVFLCNMDGIAQCIELTTGKDKWLERLKGSGACTTYLLSSAFVTEIEGPRRFDWLRPSECFELLRIAFPLSTAAAISVRSMLEISSPELPSYGLTSFRAALTSFRAALMSFLAAFTDPPSCTASSSGFIKALSPHPVVSSAAAKKTLVSATLSPCFTALDFSI